MLQQFSIELHGNYEEAVGEFAPGQKYSHIQFVTPDQLRYYGEIEYAILSKFDHEVLDMMDGYRFYGLNGELKVERWITFGELEEILEEEE